MTQSLPILPVLQPTIDIVSSPKTCPACGFPVSPLENFCPHCGVIIKKFDMPLGFGKKLYIYTIAIIGPPFGLVWFFKYFRSSNHDLKKVAYVSLILTIFSIIITMWTLLGFFQGLQSTYNNYTNLGI